MTVYAVVSQRTSTAPWQLVEGPFDSALEANKRVAPTERWHRDMRHDAPLILDSTPEVTVQVLNAFDIALGASDDEGVTWRVVNELADEVTPSAAFRSFAEFDVLIESLNGSSGERFISTRYPFTYAYDYLRSHSSQLLTGDLKLAMEASNSRANAAGVLKRLAEISELSQYELVFGLAEAYLDEHRIRVSNPERFEATQRARQGAWQSLGLAQQPTS